MSFRLRQDFVETGRSVHLAVVSLTFFRYCMGESDVISLKARWIAEVLMRAVLANCSTSSFAE